MSRERHTIGRMTLALVPALWGAVLHHPPAYSTETKPEVTKVLSEGCAEGTTLGSRDAAVVEARRAAVWHWLELELGEAPGDEFLPMLDYLDHYTASSRLLAVKSGDGRTCTELEVYLYVWPLRADAAALLFRLRSSPPRVVFLFVEEDSTVGTRTFQERTRTDKLIREAFTARGFSIIEPAGYSERELMTISGAGGAALARYGVESGADAVVAVETRLSAAHLRGGRQSVRARAEVSVRVVSASDGGLHERCSSDAEIDSVNAADGFEFALADAVYKIRERAIAGAVLASHHAAGEPLRLTIAGVGDFVVAERIAEVLRNFPGVSEARVASVRGGAALLLFYFDGRMGALVDFLQSGASGLPNLEVERVVGAEMRVRVAP